MTPDYCEPIIGYRCWDVMRTGLLTSQAIPEPWPPYCVMHAHCRSISGTSESNSHIDERGDWIVSPVMHCWCGIHAFKLDATAFARHLSDDNSYGTSRRAQGRAWGSVAMWGKLIEHQDGYRAEFAYPKELKCEDRVMADRISLRYGVPCHVVAVPREIAPYDPFDIAGMLRLAGYPYLAQPRYPPPPVHRPPVTIAIVAPDPKQIAALGGNKWQQRNAEREARRIRGNPAWQALYARGFHVKP